MFFLSCRAARRIVHSLKRRVSRPRIDKAREKTVRRAGSSFQRYRKLESKSLAIKKLPFVAEGRSPKTAQRLLSELAHCLVSTRKMRSRTAHADFGSDVREL